MKESPSSSQLISKAWELAGRQRGFWVGVVIVQLLLNIVTSKITGTEMYPWKNTHMDNQVLVGSIVQLVIMSIFAVGITRMALKAAKGKSVDFSDFTDSINMVPRFILGNILYGITILAAFLILVVPATIYFFAHGSAAYTFLIPIGILLFIFPGLYFALHFHFFSYAMIAKNLSILDSFKESAIITKGKKMRILGLLLLTGLLNVAGAVVFGIGLLFTVPTGYIATALLYHVLVDEVGKSHVPMEPAPAK